MKKLLVVTGVLIVFAITANAQKIDAAKVPASVKEAFNKLYPSTTPKWEKEDGKYEASFKMSGNDASATFASDGKLEESELGMKTTDLPASILTYIGEHYKGKKIKEAAKITLANGTVQYEAEVDGKDLIFDAAGKFLKQLKA